MNYINLISLPEEEAKNAFLKRLQTEGGSLLNEMLQYEAETGNLEKVFLKENTRIVKEFFSFETHSKAKDFLLKLGKETNENYIENLMTAKFINDRGCRR